MSHSFKVSPTGFGWVRPCLALLCLLAAFPAAARADVQTIDFDTAPPALGAPLETAGSVTFPLGQGLRPYRTEVGLRAHSGTTVGDLGRCSEETQATGGNQGSCELFQARSTATLTRTASSITFFAGRFGPVEPLDAPEQVTLTAFTAGGAELSTGPVPIDALGFNTRVSLASPAGDIARFVIEATSGPSGENRFAGDLGIDDLAVNFADGGAPDFSVATSNQILALIQGQRLEVPVQITRINGSTGPVELTVSDLPKGVTAAPVTVPGGQSAAKIALVVEPDAPDTDFQPTTATITADPLGDANVAPGPRTAPLLVRVARDFELSAGGKSERELGRNGSVDVSFPDCAAVEVPLKVRRDISTSPRDITLSLRGSSDADPRVDPATGLPPGVHAEILPSPVVPPGGGLVAERTLRFTVDSPRADFGAASITVEGRGDPAGQPHSIRIGISRAKPTASIVTRVPGSPVPVRTPRLGKQGATVRVHGSGFCPGTTVDAGNSYAPAPARLVDEHTIEFDVPRNATTGQLVIRPPEPVAPYRIEDGLTVDSFRNVNGFSFDNYDFGSLSLGEFTDAFGKDDLFLTVNPCWPFGSCRVPTGALNPVAAIEWKVIDGFFKRSDSAGRHCFGMSLAVNELGTGKHPFRNYAPPGREGASGAFELSGREGPGGSLGSFLDAEHVKQASDETIAAWANRRPSLASQLSLIEREFDQGRKPMVSMKVTRSDNPATPEDESGDAGHTVLAYDIQQTAQGADIYVYDPNDAFVPSEDKFGEEHRDRMASNTIHVDRIGKTWSYAFDGAEVWGGGDRGSLWAMPSSAVSDDPSLPGLSTLSKGLAMLLFSSEDGSVTDPRASAGAQLLPASDGGPASGAGGTLVSHDAGRPLEASFLGTESGHYTQSYIASGFVAATTDVATSRGVRDTVSGVDDSLTFESGRDRPLRIDLAQSSSGSVSTSATVETHASADGTDTAGFFAGDALAYAHDGAPTSVEFTLTTVRRDGGPATFVSGPVGVGRGDRLWAKPLDRDLRRVKLTVRDARGRTKTRVLRNQGRPRGRLKLGAAKVSKHRLAMRIRLEGLHGRAVVGASLRLMRNGRVVARRAVALKGGKSTRKVSWRLPRSLKGGHYRLLADARAVTMASRGSTAAASLRAHRAAAVWVGR